LHHFAVFFRLLVWRIVCSRSSSFVLSQLMVPS
jgi:hypothetical protein